MDDTKQKEFSSLIKILNSYFCPVSRGIPTNASADLFQSPSSSKTAAKC